MNRAFIIIGTPAFIVSFFWLMYGWGLKVAIPVIFLELGLVIGGVLYLRRRKHSAGGAGER